MPAVSQQSHRETALNDRLSLLRYSLKDGSDDWHDNLQVTIGICKHLFVPTVFTLMLKVTLRMITIRCTLQRHVT